MLHAALVHRFCGIAALGNSRGRISGLGGAQETRLVPRRVAQPRTRSIRRFDGIAALGSAVCVMGTTFLAQAQTKMPTVSCSDPQDRPNVVYVAGSSAMKPFLGTLAQVLAVDPTPFTLVYQAQGSCTGVAAIHSDDPTKQVMKDIPATGSKPANYAVFYKKDGTAQECSLDPNGNTVDVGISDVFAQTCNYSEPLSGVQIANYEGPIQPMTFIVPTGSSQRSISAEAAYFLFGTGGSKVSPWNDPTLYFIRNAASGTQQMLSRAINVPATQWWGADRGSSAAIQTSMKVLLDPVFAEKAIGIISTDIADEERSNLRILAFQAKGQSCGYWPDSTPFTRDKANVRNGHYLPWGPVHLFARVTHGLPSPAAASLVSRFAPIKIDQKLLDAEIQKHLVPKCAMKVQRTTEMGPIMPFSPDGQCSCYFDSVANGATSCQKCSAPADCPAPTPACNYGYCEAKLVRS